MKLKTRVVLLAGSAAAVLVVSVGARSSPVRRLFQRDGAVVHTEAAALFAEPADATDPQRFLVLDAFVKGNVPPSGFTFSESLGEIEVRRTQTTDSVGNVRHIAMVTDESADLDYARFLLDGSVVDTATRANGRVVDDPAGTATATLEYWEPASGMHTYRLEWVRADGHVLHSETTH